MPPANCHGDGPVAVGGAADHDAVKRAAILPLLLMRRRFDMVTDAPVLVARPPTKMLLPPARIVRLLCMPPEKANNVTDARIPPGRRRGWRVPIATGRHGRLAAAHGADGPGDGAAVGDAAGDMDSVTDSPSPAWPPTIMAMLLADNRAGIANPAGEGRGGDGAVAASARPPTKIPPRRARIVPEL